MRQGTKFVVDQRRAGFFVVRARRAAPALIVAEVSFMKRGESPVGIKKAHERPEMVFVRFERPGAQVLLPPGLYLACTVETQFR